MGAWTDDLFGNDLACDVRDAFESRLSRGMNSAAAARAVLVEFREEMEDAPECWIIWIALAAAQLRRGAPLPVVRKKALQGIAWACNPDAGSSVWPFGAPAMNSLREALGGKPPAAAAAPARAASKAQPPSPGDVVLITLPNAGRRVVAVILGPSRARGPGWIRVLWLHGLTPTRASPRAVAAALHKWKPYRQDWHRGPEFLGRTFGEYDVESPLPPRSTRRIATGVPIPPRLAARLDEPQYVVERPSDLRYILENDQEEWKRGSPDGAFQWIPDPAWEQDPPSPPS